MSDISESMHVRPTEGKIVLAGVSRNPPRVRYAFLGLNSDGSVDTSFGINGKLLIDNVGCQTLSASSLIYNTASDSPGGIIAVGPFQGAAVSLRLIGGECEPTCAPAGVRLVGSCGGPYLGNGLTWGTAYKRLQDALAAAEGSGGSITQIWVASGMYKPVECFGTTLGDRNATFALQNGVAVYGGFACGDDEFSDRDPATNMTILSGDLNSDDNPNDPFNSALIDDNSYHVITASGTNNTAILDGFTIRAGNGETQAGGGIYNNGGRPVIRNCLIIANVANHGGGLFNEHNADSSPILENCRFVNNWANDRSGGAVYNGSGSAPSFTACQFVNNTCGSFPGVAGGAMQNSTASPIVIGCTFMGNSSPNGYGGALGAFSNSSAVISDCTFTNNSALQGGGAITNQTGATLTILDCTFVGNSTQSSGGAMYGTGSDSTFSSYRFLGNSAGFMEALSIRMLPAVSRCGAARFRATPALVTAVLFSSPTAQPAISRIAP